MANVETAFAIAMIRDAAVCLTRAEGDDIFHSTQSHWFATGVVGLKRGVEALGFRLVPIETPAEAHDKAIAARVAEEPSAAALGFDLVKRPAVDEAALEMHFSDGALPVTDKPGFDGRDNSSIDDNVWSR